MSVFWTLIKPCIKLMGRPTKQEIRAAAASFRGAIGESRKINDLVRNIMTSKGRSTVPTLVDLVGPDPETRIRVGKPRPAPAMSPQPATTKPTTIQCQPAPGQGRCDCCGALMGQFKCPTYQCHGPGGDYWMAGTHRLEPKNLIPNTAERLLELINSPGVCGKPTGAGFAPLPPWRRSWTRPIGLTVTGALAIPGMIKQTIATIAEAVTGATATPGEPSLIPGQLPGEVCGRIGGAPFKWEVWGCGAPNPTVYLSRGQRFLVYPGLTAEALVNWVNSLP